MKELYCRAFKEKEILEFIEKAEKEFYAEDGDQYKLTKYMGKAMAYAEAGYAMSHITEDQANKLIEQAKDIIRETLGGYH